MQSCDGVLERPSPTASTHYCPFCEDSSLAVVQEQDPADPFSFANIISAGTITVTVHDSKLPCTSNNHEWSLLPERLERQHTRQVGTPFRELAFLAKHLFLRATCRLGASGRLVFIRIYLVPNDLPNFHGRLHRRPEAVTKEAQLHMQTIVPLIVQNNGLWNGEESCLDAPLEYLLPNYIDNRSMAEIFSDLPSPSLDPADENTSLSHCIASGDVIWGLRTTLYGYQRHSVAVMCHRESSTKPVQDPLFIPLSSMTGTCFYVRPSTLLVMQDCPAFSPSQAGILCEELGSGKTVMIIALILATASQLAGPEESLMTVKQPVMTPLAFHHFPSTEHALARKEAGLGHGAIQQVPSLVELLVHYFSMLRVNTGHPAFVDKLEATHLWPFIQTNKCFYHHYTEKSEWSKRRSANHAYPRTMYLSSATLVVVPITLLGQWKNEINKHCHDYVRYLVVCPSMVLPDARKLASDYELIIMSNIRFHKESRRNKIENLHNLEPCTCPCMAGSRVPDCHCPGDPDVTPLLQVRWKRLVIDEGHITGNVAATVNHFVCQLSIQHKWIVTGTPTSNILGLQLGRDTNREEFDLVYPDSNLPMSILSQEEGYHMRIWGNYDRTNLRKLETMIKVFLSVPQFHTNQDSFKSHVSTPLCDQHGPRPGAIRVLSQVMQMIMVRHRIEDVENDVLLPPMRHETVYMDLDSYALKSYNAMQAAVAVNAIDSERKDVDYLFHPSQAKDLQATINNSSQGLFWSASDTLYNVDQICELADKYIDRAREHNMGPEDMDLLQQALKHAAIAAKDKMWRAMQPYADIPFKVSGLDTTVFEAWTRTGLRSSGRTIDVMHPDRLTSLRSLVRKKHLISRDDIVKEGKAIDRAENSTVTSKPTHSHKAKHSVKQTKEMTKEVQGKIKSLKKHVERIDVSDEELEDWQEGDRINGVSSTEVAATRETRSSLLSGVIVGPSLSTKLNYILSEVQRYSAKEKFLIFSNSVLTLFQIGEALSLFDIKYLRYTNAEECLLREQCVITFETSDVHRILLMELKLGARGLNLISASRVIFCEPVWHPDVESQAIKRVHRIGQTRPVTVKTLAIRATAEEAMIARREYLRSSDKVPSMTTESGMRQYLQHPCFLAESASNDPINVVLSLDDNRVDFSEKDESSGGDGIHVDVPISEGMARKRVRYGDPVVM